jgi:glycosyltransferase involved in cell wall biosynthesis
MKMKVVVASHDLSHNCLGRAHVLADLIRTGAEVEIVGPAATGRIWAPLREQTDIPVAVVPRRMSPAQVAQRYDADVVYAVKARSASLGRALATRALTGVPVVSDVDDWEMSFFLDEPRWLLRNAVDLRNPDNLWATWRAERAVRRADAVTVSSRFLRDRFGGQIVPHARDASAYRSTVDTGFAEGTRLRAELGLAGERVVLFLGSARPHKGLHLVVAALDRLADPRLAFVVVGGATGLPRRPWLRVLPAQPYHRVPEFLALADIVALPQLATRTAAAQVPAKVFDAMAMGRPVVASRVSDLPEILRGCGVIVEPGDVAGLAGALRGLVDDPARARMLGLAARARFEAEYSYDAVRPRVQRLIRTVARSRQHPTATRHRGG